MTERKLITEDGLYIRSFFDTTDLLHWLFKEDWTPKQSGRLIDGYIVNGVKLESDSLKNAMIKLGGE